MTASRYLLLVGEDATSLEILGNFDSGADARSALTANRNRYGIFVLQEIRLPGSAYESRVEPVAQTGGAGAMTPQSLTWIDRFYRYLETERRLSPNTLKSYQFDLARLVTYCDQHSLRSWPDVGVGEVRRFAAKSYTLGLSPVSVQRQLSAVRTFMNFLIREGVIHANFALVVQAPKAARRLPNLLDVDQMARLLDIQGSDPLTIRDRAMMELMYSSALRVSECTGALCADLDLAEGLIRVLGKGNVVRLSPVGSCALTALRSWLRVRKKVALPGEQVLFVGRNGKRLTTRNVQQRVAYWALKQGLQMHVHPHMFRHSCATHVLESSRDIRAVQELLGHASISTTQIYTHLDFQHLMSTYEFAHPRARRQGRYDDSVLRDQRQGDSPSVRGTHQDSRPVEERDVPSPGNGSHDSIGGPGTL